MSDENWGAQPLEEKEPKDDSKVGAERVCFKMPIEDSTEMIEVNLLQVINQLFVDMAHFHNRVCELEEAEEKRKSNIILPDDIEIKV